MPNPIYHYEGAEFLSTAPQAAAAAGAFVGATGSMSIVVSQLTQLLEQETVDVPVMNAHGLVPNELLRIAGQDYPDYQLNVVSVNVSRTVLTLQNYGAAITLGPGDELFPVMHVPMLYRDASLAHAYGGVLPRTDSAGRWEFYAKEPTIDLTVSGGGLALDARYTAWAGFRLTRANSTLDVRDFESIQEAIDALPPEGGTVFIPAGIWYLTETLYTPCDRPCHLLGEGSNYEGDKGTVLVWTTNTSMLRLRGSNTSVRKMVLRNDSAGVSSAEHLGAGIMIGRRTFVDAHPHPGTSATQTEYEKGGFKPLQSVVLEDLTVKRAPGWGLSIPGHGYQTDNLREVGFAEPEGEKGGTISFWVSVNRVKIIESQRFGGIFAGTGCTTIFFTEGGAIAHGVGQAAVPAFYAYIRGVTHPSFHKWTFEGTSPEGDATGISRPWVKLVGCEAVVLDTVYFENDTHDPGGNNPGEDDYAAQYFLAFTQRNRAVSIRNVFFARHGASGGKLRCVYCERDGVKGLSLEQPCALSSTSLSQFDSVKWVPLDRDAIVLNGGTAGNADNEHIVLAGAGVARDATMSGALEFPPLTHSEVPLTTHVLGTHGLVVPRSTPDLREADLPENHDMMMREGSIVVEALTSGESPVHGLVYSTGPNSGWRHIANVPTLNEDERAEWDGWRQGDMVVDPDERTLLLRMGDDWQAIASIPE